MQPDALGQILSRAAKRRALIRDVASGATTAFRLCDGAGDGLPGVFIDTYAGHWLVQIRDVPFPDALSSVLPEGCEALWLKELTHAGSRRESPRWISGFKETAITVTENDVRYAIDFASGYSQGIFLDQRENREWLRGACCSSDHVLNLFAYTCSFSVAAGLSDASTTSVDLSPNYLDWGRRNFLLNGIDYDQGGSHRFFNWDTFEFLKRADRKGERYSFIVCDPPTFSRNKAGKVFAVEKDYATLISRCTEVLSEGGTILCSTNHKALSQRKFIEMVRKGVAIVGRSIDELQVNDMPPDFTGYPYLKSLRLRVT